MNRRIALIAPLAMLALVVNPAQGQEVADEMGDEAADEMGDEATEDEAASTEEPAAAPVETQEAGTEPGLATSRNGADGTRFRFGVSGGPGFFTVKPESGTGKVGFAYGGVDLRFGAQINDLVGVYGQPTLGYYSAGDTQFLAVGGLLGLAAGVDITLIDRVFVGAGIGYTIYNNPAGVSPLLRVGVYPLVSRSAAKVRRKGLMLGADLRVTKLADLKSIVMPTLNLGYEAF